MRWRFARGVLITTLGGIGLVLLIIAAGFTDPQPVGDLTYENEALPIAFEGPGTLAVDLYCADGCQVAWSGGGVRMSSGGYLGVTAEGAEALAFAPWPHLRLHNKLWVMLDGSTLTVYVNDEFAVEVPTRSTRLTDLSAMGEVLRVRVYQQVD